MKISYLSGPADVSRFLGEIERDEKSDYFGTNYMKLYLRLAQSLDARSQIFTWFEEEPFEQTIGEVEIINWPLVYRPNILFHWDMIGWNLAAMLRMWRFRPDIVLLTGQQGYWWLYWPLRLTGATFLASFHCVQWPKYGRASLHMRLYSWLNARLILRGMPAILSTSQDIRDQIESMLAGAKVPIIDHLPSYSPDQFAGISPPLRPAGTPFTTLFTGRLEANKGIFDIVAIAERLERTRPGEFRFHLCGDGGDREKIESEIIELGLDACVILHGHCGPDTIRALMSESQACIAPTRSDFEAGFEMTCAEAILSGRPLISSPVCPAVHYLTNATVVVPPDDVDAYHDAIVALADDPAFYAVKQAACAPLQRQFYDEDNGWTSAMRRAIGLATRAHPVAK